MFDLERVNNAWNNFVRELEKLSDEDEKAVKRALKAAITISPPDNVKDIPINLSKSDFKVCDGTSLRAYTVSQYGNISEERVIVPYEKLLAGTSRRRLFPTEEYAKDFYRMTQLIADCRHFKYLYDEDYVPDRTEPYKKTWRVCYDYDLKAYSATWDDSRTDTGEVYFSSEYLAGKCAEWLNWVYKCGEYADETEEE